MNVAFSYWEPGVECDAPPTAECLRARYTPKITRRVRRLLGRDDELDDIVQEVLIVMFRKAGTLRDQRCLDAWVNQVTINTVKYFLRRRRFRRHAHLDDLAEAELPSSRLDVESKELESHVIAVLDRMPPNERALLMRYWFTPATAEALALQAGVSLITLRRRLFKAKARFERLVRQDPVLSPRLDEGQLPLPQVCPDGSEPPASHRVRFSGVDAASAA